VLPFGDGEQIKVISTPGHTAGSISFLWRDRVFTGDALFINGCGRTDFQSGDAGKLYDAITERLFTLPGETLVYPGHDYNKRWVSSVEQERTTNARLAGKTRDEFIEIMKNLNLPKPRLIDEAVPANRWCGVSEEQARQDASTQAGTPGVAPAAERAATLTPQDLVMSAKREIKEVDVAIAKSQTQDPATVVVDVREPDEYAAGHLPRAVNVPRGVLEFRAGGIPELANPNAKVLLYCRSGGRSALAAQALQRLGYTNVFSMSGGYDAWQAQSSMAQAAEVRSECGA
jgi:rhodanese-related sulfurtransferase